MPYQQASTVRSSSLHAARAPAAPCPPACQPVCRPSSYASLSTRQRASAFNQLLSFDTSSVTTMQDMFYVRSARALPVASTVGSCLHALLAPPPPHALPPPISHLAPFPMLYF